MMARGTSRLLAEKASAAILDQIHRAEAEQRDFVRNKGLIQREVVLDLLLDCMQQVNQIHHTACIFIADPLADSASQRATVAAWQRKGLATIARLVLVHTARQA